MDLGRCFLKRITGNTLKNAFHPVHGLLWTDGSSVFHTPSYSLSGGQAMEDGTLHKRLGQFGQVHGISWSSDSKERPLYVSIISQAEPGSSPEMALWRVETFRPGIHLSQVGSQTLESPPLPHGAGCVWHPQEDRVCIIQKTAATVWAVCEKGRKMQTSWQVSSRESISVHNMEDATPQSLHGSRFTCGSWDLSGTKLVLATESKLLFFTYMMQDLESQCALIIGRVSCIETIDVGKFLCTVDLPLDGLVCTLSTEKEPPATATGGGAQPDDTTSLGALEELLNVHHNPDSPVTASSQLVIISWQQEKPQIVNRIVISGIVAPDLLAWESSSSTCMVGSNSSNILQAYTIIHDTMTPSKELMLKDSKRPKGVAIQNQEVWLMVGESSPALYPPQSIPTTEYSEYSVIMQQMTPGLPAHMDDDPSYGSLRRHCATSSSFLPTVSESSHLIKPDFTLPPPTAHSLTNLAHITGPSPYPPPPPAATVRHSRTTEDCQTRPKKFNSTSLKMPRHKAPVSTHLSNSLDSKRFPAVDTVEFMGKRGGSSGIVATTAALEVAPSLESDDEVAFRLTRIEQCLVDLSSRQSQELREIKSEMATTKQLLTSVFLQLLPGEVRKEVISAVSEEFKEEVLELKDTINKNMAKTEDISAEFQAELVRCKTEIDMMKDQLRDLEGRKEYQY